MDSNPAWEAWAEGNALCPLCKDMPYGDWFAMCDCFYTPEDWERITGQKRPEWRDPCPGESF